ncbi:MAG: hypothetical protein L0215_19275 [Gemmataceae bacterium]|nr:hypothetical protein [Gemmataceae bacterium]
MSKTVGRSYALSPFRRMVVELMHFCSKVPGCSVDRRLHLGELLAARNACFAKPSWYAIFAKAYGIVARDTPILRTSYMTFPWARLYEHPFNIVTLNIEREWQGEKVILQAHVRRPECRTLTAMDDKVRYFKNAPLESIKAFRNTLRMGKLLGPLRRFMMWGTLNIFGRRRCHNFGTFSITSVASAGAGLLYVTPLLTTTLHHSLFDEHGNLEMRIIFDHRVLDGATAARAVADFDEVLRREILTELRSMRASLAA